MMTSYGGAIMICQREAIAKARSVTSEERHIAALVLERSFVDLKSQVSVNGTCNNIFSSDIKFLMNDHAGAKVWSAGYLSFALCSNAFFLGSLCIYKGGSLFSTLATQRADHFLRSRCKSEAGSCLPSFIDFR